MTQDKPYAKGAVYPFPGKTMLSPLTLPPFIYRQYRLKEKIDRWHN